MPPYGNHPLGDDPYAERVMDPPVKIIRWSGDRWP